MPAIVRKSARHPTAESRLSAMGARLTSDNPITPILLDMLEAARTGRRMDDGSALSQIYNTRLLGRIPQAHLDRLHANLETLSPAMRTRVSPMARRAVLPHHLSRERALLDTRIARGVAEALMPQRRIDVPLQTVRKLDLHTTFGGVDFGKTVMHDIDPAVLRQVFNPGTLVLAPLPDKPVLESILPKAPQGYMPQQKLTLRVSYPDVPSPTFKVILSHSDDVKIDGQSLSTDYAVLTPKVLGKPSPWGTRLSIVLPDNLFDRSWIRVVVTSGGKAVDSNRMEIDRLQVATNAAILASPEITAVKPAGGHLPGSVVQIEGHNIGRVAVKKQGNDAHGNATPGTPTVDMKGYVRLMSAKDPSSDVKLPLTVGSGMSADGLVQAQCTLPMNLLPGDYWLLVGNEPNGIIIGAAPVFEHGAESLTVDFRVDAFKYAIHLDNVHCADESDPEWAGGDEILAQWAGFGDATEFSKGTNELSGFDDGETKSFSPSDSSIFPVAGGFGEVKIALGLEIALFENDDSDVKVWQTTMQAVGSVSTAVGKLLLELGQPTAAAIAGVVTAVAEAISTIAGLFGGTDPLGSQQLLWSALDLQKLTDNPAKRFSGVLPFHNSDDDGSYDVVYTVSRLG